MSHRERAPNAFILGAAKSGTTSLYQYLSQHPDVYFPAAKEPQFYCNEDLFSRGQRYYLDTFFDEAAPYRVRMDATPHYLYYEKVADRLKVLPQADQLRFIIILREPVSRAYSHYWNSVYEGLEDKPFDVALALEEQRIASPDLARRGTLTYHYFNAGLYGKQLTAYYKRFNRDQFLVLFQEDLQRQPTETLARTFEFLGLNQFEADYEAAHNEAGVARSRALQRFIRQPNALRRALGGWLPYPVKLKLAQAMLKLNKRPAAYPALDGGLASHLRGRFLADITTVEQLTNRNLGHWKRSGPV